MLAAVCLALVTPTAAACAGTHGGTGPGATAGPGRGGPGGTHPPQPQQAYALAQKEFGLLAGGGWAQAWSLWTTGAQRAVPQAEFVRVNTACRPVLGVPYLIDDSAVAGPAAVRIGWHRAGARGSNTLVHQGGRWRFTPDARTLADYRLGADRLIRQRRAAGSCH